MSSQLLSKVDAVMKELTASYSALEEQAKASISLVRQLLDQKEAVSIVIVVFIKAAFSSMSCVIKCTMGSNISVF